MVDFVCTSSSVAQLLQDSVQWQLLMKHLERNGICANVWVDGEEEPMFIQSPFSDEMDDSSMDEEIEVESGAQAA